LHDFILTSFSRRTHRGTYIALNPAAQQPTMPKILVIEDEEMVRRALSQLLKHMKYETLEAPNGAAGVQVAHDQKPDLVLCDVNMPQMDGHSVLKKLRQDPETNSIPFIFLTGNSEKEDLRKGMNLGADDYLTKPVSLEELRKAIEVRLNRHAQITERYTHELQQAEEKVKRLVYYDTITELPNRLMVSELLQEVLKNGATEVGVLFLKLDRFKRFNGGLGYFHSDVMLTVLSQRLRRSLKYENVAARISEDAFAIFVKGGHNETEQFAKTLLECIEKPFVVDSHNLYLTASIGIAMFPEDGNRIDVLLKKASVAVDQAQRNGGSQYLFRSNCADLMPTEDLFLETDLRGTLERSELDVHYQPQIDVKTGRIVGAEALMRWKHPDKGMISPGRFIPVAEETGFIVGLGEWVLGKACSELKKWRDQTDLPLRVAVNLSGVQFRRPDLVSRLMEILQRSGVTPHDIELEVTESILIHNPDSAMNRLKELKALGVKISLDDFGTGYSSFTYIKQFPFDAVKIDRSFIMNVNHDSKSSAIVTAIIQMAQNLNLRIIAEGVETFSEFVFLKSHNCDEVQGYLFSKPIASTEFMDLIQQPDLVSKILEANS
jgi:diguanylate cyclase (GGDEF)-like protein